MASSGWAKKCPPRFRRLTFFTGHAKFRSTTSYPKSSRISAPAPSLRLGPHQLSGDGMVLQSRGSVFFQITCAALLRQKIRVFGAALPPEIKVRSSNASVTKGATMATCHQTHGGIGVPRQTRLEKSASKPGTRAGTRGSMPVFGQFGPKASTTCGRAMTIRPRQQSSCEPPCYALGRAHHHVVLIVAPRLPEPKDGSRICHPSLPDLPKSPATAPSPSIRPTSLSERPRSAARRFGVAERAVCPRGRTALANQPKRFELREFRDQFERPVPDDFGVRIDHPTDQRALESDGTFWRTIVSVRD